MADQEKIREQAKKIMDEFIAALDSVGAKSDAGKDLAFGEERAVTMRHHETKSENPDFRKSIFHNAPKKDDDYIIAEKKKW